MYNITNFFYKNIVLMGMITLAVLTGCDDDLLDKAPKDRLSAETFWNTGEDARLAVNDLYNDLPGVYALIWDSMSDIAMPNNIFFAEAVYVRGIQDPQSVLSASTWNGGYTGIRAVNEFLINVDRVENADQALINRFRAEARVIRAFEYLRLITTFGDVPLITTPITIEESKTLPRTDTEEIYDFISTELQESADALPVSYDQMTDQGRITRGAALALKARAMLHAGRYAEAHGAAKAVMDLGAYGLYPSYENLFTYGAENNQEVILDKQFIINLYSNDIFARFGLSALGLATSLSFPVPTKNIVDAYEMSNGMDISDPGSGYDPLNPYEDRDPRLGYSMFTYGDTLPDGNIYDPRPGFGGLNDITKGQASTNTGFDVKKYVNWEDRPDPFNSGINVILIRYAEVLLTYAEAKIEAGTIDQSVYDAINKVRQRPDVNMPPVVNSGQSQDEMRQIVRHERMVELAFEGQRFFDVRRWGIAEEVLNGPIEGIPYENPDGELVTYTYPDYQRFFNAPKHYLWPIPEKEVELNANITQNPGY